MKKITAILLGTAAMAAASIASATSYNLMLTADNGFDTDGCWANKGHRGAGIHATQGCTNTSWSYYRVPLPVTSSATINASIQGYLTINNTYWGHLVRTDSAGTVQAWSNWKNIPQLSVGANPDLFALNALKSDPAQLMELELAAIPATNDPNYVNLLSIYTSGG